MFMLLLICIFFAQANCNDLNLVLMFIPLLIKAVENYIDRVSSPVLELP